MQLLSKICIKSTPISLLNHYNFLNQPSSHEIPVSNSKGGHSTVRSLAVYIAKELIAKELWGTLSDCPLIVKLLSTVIFGLIETCKFGTLSKIIVEITEKIH